MIALKCILIACLVCIAAAGDNTCARESGDKSLGIITAISVSLGVGAPLNTNFPDCRITCIRCLLGGVQVQVTVNTGGYGCPNANALVGVGLGVYVCEIFGVQNAPGAGPPTCTS